MKLSILKKIVEGELVDRGISYFLGGSERFGYAVSGSDLDVIVFGNKTSINNFLSDLGGAIVHRSNKYQSSSLCEVHVMDGKVHVIIFSSKTAFDELKAEHDRIDSLLKKNTYLAEFIKQLKQVVPLGTGSINEGAGAKIFRILSGFAVQQDIPVKDISVVNEEVRDRFLRPAKGE